MHRQKKNNNIDFIDIIYNFIERYYNFLHQTVFIVIFYTICKGKKLHYKIDMCLTTHVPQRIVYGYRINI